MLGRVVYPFCLKHRVRLMALESPLVREGEITPADLMLAVMICAEEPIGEFSLLDKWRVLRMTSDRKRFEAELARFIAYVQISAWPKFWEKEGTSKEDAGGSMPWPLSVIAGLVSNGIPEQRAWEMPECQAVWYSCAFAKAKGVDLNVLSTEEEDFMEQVRLASPPEVKTHEQSPGVSDQGEV